MKRRKFIQAGAVSSFGLAFAGCQTVRRPRFDAARSQSAIPSFDLEMENFMKARNVPGGSLAVVKDGRLVYARGYGLADREKEIAATPTTLFRIASISKPITAVAVMKLVQDGKLNLDDKAFDHVDLEPVFAAGEKADSRLKQITIRQLLHHTGGWDRGKSFDPMFRSDRIAKRVGVDRPADAQAVIRYMLGKPLDFDPGSSYAYSNFGYCVLGRIIESVSGQGYETYVRSNILKPMGITRMRIGGTLDGKQAEGEARYYMPKSFRGGRGSSVFPEKRAKVPWPYGAFHLEAMDAHGGWIASAVDLARFAAALDVPNRQTVVEPELLSQLYQPPAPPVSRTDGKLAPAFYGLGWMVRPTRPGKANYWHGGSLPGTSTLLVRRWDGLSWAVLFNQRSRDKKLPDGAIDSALHRAAKAVKEWPTKDLFKSV
jgi:N-acyl-D-amino-acid deacylase